MKMKLLFLTSVVAFAAIVPQAFSQTEKNAGEENPAQNCRADTGPGSEQNDAILSLTDQLDNCDGVIKPPKVGDTEIQVPAPRAGSMPVIAPGDLPDQQSDLNENEENSGTEKAIESGAGIDQIVGMIAKSSDVAKQLEKAGADPLVNVVNVSVIFKGAKSAVLKTALRLHEKDVDRMRSSLAENKTVVQTLQSKGVPLKFVVAASMNEDGSITVFVR